MSHVLFLLFVIRPPPASPLFPYTTLFRSRRRDRGAHTRLITEVGLDRTFPAGLACQQNATIVADRKSTRLNSSHGSISYAVFCLKKKNENGVARCVMLAHAS